MPTEQEIRFNAKRLESAGAPLEDIEEYVRFASQKLTTYSPPSPSQSLAKQAIIFGGKPLTQIFDVPYVTRPLTQAGETVKRGVMGVGQRLEESSKELGMNRLMKFFGGKAIKFAGEAGASTPENLSLQVGTSFLLPMKTMAFKDKLDDLTRTVAAEFKTQFGREATPEEIGQVIRQSFEKGIAPEVAETEAKNLAMQRGTGRVAKFETARFGEEALTPLESGQSIKSEIVSKEASMANKTRELYSKLESELGDQPASSVENTKKFIDVIFKQKGVITQTPTQEAKEILLRKNLMSSGVTESTANEFIATFGDVNSGKLTSASLGERTLNAYKFMNSVLDKLGNPNIKAKDLTRLATNVNQYAYSGIEGPIKNVYKALGHVLVEDVNKTAEDLGVSILSKGAREFYKGFKTFQETDVIEAILSGKKDPSQILDYMTKTPERVDRLMEHLTVQGKEKMRNGILNGVHEAAMDKATGIIDPKKIASEIGKISDDTLKSVFGEKYFIVDAYRKYSSEIAKSRVFSEPEIMKTATLLRSKQNSQLVEKVMDNKAIETLRDVLGHIDDKAKTALKQGVWDQLLRDSIGKDRVVDLGKLAGNIQKIESSSPGWLKMLYGEDYNAIPALEKIAAYAGKHFSEPFAQDIARAAISINPAWRLFMAGKAVFKGILPKIQGPGVIGGIIKKENAIGLMGKFFKGVKPSVGGALEEAGKQIAVRFPFKFFSRNKKKE